MKDEESIIPFEISEDFEDLISEKIDEYEDDFDIIDDDDDYFLLLIAEMEEEEEEEEE